MSVYTESLKQMNLVEFLSNHYGLVFKSIGSGFVASSPFGADRHPSFFVRQLDGKWLFKDFSSGIGGSIIDLIGQLERLSGIGAIIRHIEALIGCPKTLLTSERLSVEPGPAKKDYDIESLYQRFRQQDSGACRQYLISRGIDESLVDELIVSGDVVHNQYRGKSYCCFAVRNAAGALQCLDNHEIAGGDKFVLGNKAVYSRDWSVLSASDEVYISEGIIDYLSIKTLEGGRVVGLALLGNQLIFEASLLAGCQRIIAATDGDRGGISAFVDLMEIFPDKELVPYPLEDNKDPNQLLQARKKTGRRLDAGKKLELYRAFQRSTNKSELAREWGIDRSYLYEVVKDCEQLLTSALESRQPGRPAAGQPGSMQEARRQITDLQEQLGKINHEHSLSICREEFLKLRLKWAQIETAELRGEPVDEATGPKHKTQIKKKRKKRRSK